MGLGSAMEARGATPPDILCAIDQRSHAALYEPPASQFKSVFRSFKWNSDSAMLQVSMSAIFLRKRL